MEITELAWQGGVSTLVRVKVRFLFAKRSI
jgi:hypothetical protein